MAIKIIYNSLDSFVSSIEPFKDTCEVRVGFDVKVSTSENLKILFACSDSNFHQKRFLLFSLSSFS